jgi:hypothetical protein
MYYYEIFAEFIQGLLKDRLLQVLMNARQRTER